MEKKNTMLLTVIAVATLLVAVVGATFAYFSITVEGGTSTTAATMQTQQLPTITMKTGESTFGIAATVQDMAMNNSGARWAINTSDKDSSNASSGKGDETGLYYWSSEEKKYNLFSISTSGVGATTENDGSTYECPVTITLSADKAISELTSGDLILYLYSKGGDVEVSDMNASDNTQDLIEDWKNSTKTYLMNTEDKSSGHSGENGCATERGCYDVSDLFKTSNIEKKLYTVVIVKNDTTSSDGEGTSVLASMKLVNKSSADQSGLAGKDIRITIISQLDKAGCKVITKAAE